MTPTLSIFVPAYNAAATLPQVIARIPEHTWAIVDTVFIINDGSADETGTVARRLAAEYPKVRVIDMPTNQGYGRVVKRGLELCRDETRADHFACLHGDGQYPPEKLRDFAEHMAGNNIDVLQGSRHKDGTALQGGMPYYKWLFGHVLTACENAVFGLQMTDYHSGYMFYSRRAVATVPIDRLSTYFDFDLEFIASAKKRGLRIDELGIPTRYGEEVSYLNPFVYGMKTVKVMFKYVTGGYGAPRKA